MSLPEFRRSVARVRIDRRDQCTNCGRGTQQTETPGTGLQDIPRIYRQQRDHPAEHDDAEVERDCSKNDPVLAKIGKAGKHCLKRDGFLFARRITQPDETHQNARGNKGKEAKPVNDFRTKNIKDAAERRLCRAWLGWSCCASERTARAG